MTAGHIRDIPVDKLATIIAGLVREGVTFNATPIDDAGRYFNIELTGGH